MRLRSLFLALGGALARLLVRFLARGGVRLAADGVLVLSREVVLHPGGGLVSMSQ